MFDVWVAAAVRLTEARYIGIAIGGVGVPQAMLAHHQELRRDPPLLRGSGPQHFRDLLATGPIDVLIGPTTTEAASLPRGRDMFALPQFDDARQRVPPGAKDVVLTMNVE